MQHNEKMTTVSSTMGDIWGKSNANSGAVQEFHNRGCSSVTNVCVLA